MILAVPTLLLLGAAGLGVATQLAARTDAEATAHHVDLVLATQELIHSLQRERGLTLGVLGGESRFRPELGGQRRTTDRARAALDPLIADAGVPGVPSVRTSLEPLSALASVRAGADANATTRQDMFGYFTTAIGAIIDASFAVEVGHSDQRLLRGLRALEALSRAKEATGQERATVNGAFAAGSFTTAEYVRFLEARAARLDAFQRFRRLGTPEQTSALDLSQRSAAATTTAALELKAVAGSRGQPLRVDPRSWYAAITSYIDGLREVQRGVGDDVRTLAAQNREQDTGRLVALGVLVGLLVLGAVLLSVATSRSILRPLRRDTEESLANLGRRNQSMVRRQLGVISTLGRAESDPGTLANLSELDHLATRMRRNAESLLVLVGESGPRRSAVPVAVGDVLRLALAEVEDYRRVVLHHVDETWIRGAVVAEVAHLVAELVENALVFSPPEQRVEIHARADGGAYQIAIVDHGPGMSPQELDTANARLRGVESFLVAPVRHLGHYVAGRLADRLGVRVWLHESPPHGITARVVLPADSLARDTVRAAQPADSLAQKSARAAGQGAERPPVPDGTAPVARPHEPPTVGRRAARRHRRADEPVYTALVSESEPERVSSTPDSAGTRRHEGDADSTRM